MDYSFHVIGRLYAFCFVLAAPVKAEPVTVVVRPDMVRSIGGVTEFRRHQFITAHMDPSAKDLKPEEARYLEDELEISYGRDGGRRTWVRSQTKADPMKPDFPDAGHLLKQAKKEKVKRKTLPHYKPESYRHTILCTHPETFYAREGQDASAFGPTSFEGAAEFSALFLRDYWDADERPRLFEVFNEPFVHRKQAGATIEGYCKQHVAVAKRVKQLTPEVLVGGYTAAYPEMEIRNFSHWDSWMKTFMDLAGAEMDFFSTHIYDGVNVTGEPRNRTGSNSEAILDIIDQYGYLLYGKPKPHVISEFGLIPDGGMEPKPYSAKRSGEMIRSTNAQLLTFMNHPDRLLKVIPFFLTKGMWTYNFKGKAKPGEANPFLLWRRLEDGSFVKTDLVKYYRFWKGVKGSWRASRSFDPDVLCQFLADGDRLNLILMNIEPEARTLELKGLDGLDARGVVKRSLRVDGEVPVLEESAIKGVPQSLDLTPGETVLLKIELSKPVEPAGMVHEKRCYATSYLKDIKEGKPMVFSINKVPTGEGGAVLRVGIGREKQLSLKPKLVFNGKPLAFPEDWAGDDQAGRKTFFGVIELPVPMEDVKADNTVELVFPDSGGKVSSVILQVNRFKEK